MVSSATSLRDGLKSIAQELLVLLVFLLTWTVTRYVMKGKKDDSSKVDLGKVKRVKAQKSPAEVAETIVSLCQDQFTRGLRLYRDMVKRDLDKEVTDEDFYMSLVEASVRVNKPDVAEQVITRMSENEMRPSADFVQSVLKLFSARKLHTECLNAWKLFSPHLEPHQVIYSCATVAACETGDVALARKLLSEARSQFQISSREWLALMRHHVRSQDWEAAAKDLRDLMADGAPVDNIVFNTALSTHTSSQAALPTMRALLDEMSAYEEKYAEETPKTVDIVSYNTLMKALARSGDVEACFKLLEQLIARGVTPDDVSFSTLLDVCIDEDAHDLASVALERMSAAGVKINCVVMTTLMKPFISSRRLDKAIQLYDSMKATNSQVKPDMITHSMLIKAHCDAHDMGTALKILEDMLESECSVDDVVFTHLIEGCCQVNNVRLAEKLFADMKQANIKPSIYTLNGLVKVYGKCSMADQAIALVQNMEEEYGVKPTVVIYTCLVSGLIRQKKYKDAWNTYKRMGETIRPDAQGTQTMLVGLADGQLFAEFLELAQQTLQAYSPNAEKGPKGTAMRPRTLPECLNYGLNAMLNRSKVPQG